MSDQRRAFQITIEELVTRYRAIKGKSLIGQNIGDDILRLESAIIRLYKEMNLEDIYFLRVSYHTYGMQRNSEAHSDKNSMIDTFPVKRKMFGDDSEVLRRKLE